jgi:hypothetical protein
VDELLTMSNERSLNPDYNKSPTDHTDSSFHYQCDVCFFLRDYKSKCWGIQSYVQYADGSIFSYCGYNETESVDFKKVTREEYEIWKILNQ